MKATQEEFYYKQFQKHYSEFPLGKSIQGDKPDYVLHCSDKTIGIEITQVFIDNQYEIKSKEKEKESLQNELGNILCSKFESIMDFKFVLTIQFSKETLSKKNFKSIISVCETYLKTLNFSEIEGDIFEVFNWGFLPKEIDTLQFCKFPSLEQSIFSEIAGGIVPNLTTNYLAPILNKKNNLLEQYQPCDEFWLLIIEGTSYSDGFDQIQIDEFQTKFNKVFLYRHFKKQVIELK